MLLIRERNSRRKTMSFNYSGKIAVVTGATRGIGRGIAMDLASQGAVVVGWYNSSWDRVASVEQEIRDLGGETMFLKADVSREQDVLKASAEVLDEYGTVDFLVNNAGIHQHLKSWDLTLEDWNRVLTTNLTSQFLVSKAFIPTMKENRSGRIVNISSCVAYMGTDHEVHYGASKSGTIALTKSLALELAEFNINVNAIAPGYIHSDMCQFRGPEHQSSIEQTIPKRRIGVPLDIARSVSFLCSDGADYITGQMFHVNGGLIMP